MVAEGKEKQCRVCHCGFGASVWKYKCTDCAHYFCSSHCKDLWLRADDVDEDEEDPFTVLKDEEAPVDPSELPGSVILQQVTNGVAVRMAVLFTLLGSGSAASIGDSQ